MKNKMQVGKLRYSNIEIVEPEGDGDKLTLEKINESFFKEILRPFMLIQTNTCST